jgi:hypothetical protein
VDERGGGEKFHDTSGLVRWEVTTFWMISTQYIDLVAANLTAVLDIPKALTAFTTTVGFLIVYMG